MKSLNASLKWVGFLETATERDFFDLHVLFPKVRQIIIRAREPHAAHIVANGLARTVKYLVEIAHRDPSRSCNLCGIKTRIVEIVFNERGAAAIDRRPHRRLADR